MGAAAQALALPAVVDLDTLEPWRDQLVDALDAGAVTVVGSSVERVSTNALLMLVSAAESAQRSARGFTLKAPSAAMTSAIERLGLTHVFAGFTTG